MDPLEIITNLQNVKPAYQPIVSAIRHNVVGYEILGRYWEGNEWVRLRSFFLDNEVPDEFKMEVDQHLTQIALSEILESDKEGFLLLKRNAKQLMVNHGEDLLRTLKSFEQKGLSMERIVLAITEHDFDEEFDTLNHLLLYYKTYGIKVAIDHIGIKNSNIDRIRHLEPHILKIDTNIIRDHHSEGFQDIIYSLSMLAHRIGAALLFNNIEDNFHLQFAWKHGGMFYQGQYLAPQKFDLSSLDSLTVNVKGKIAEYIQREKNFVEQRQNLVLIWEQKAKSILSQWKGIEKIDSFIKELTTLFNEESFRMFVCNSDGYQVSSNFRKRDEGWKTEPDKKGSNWAFRPYFLENTLQMKTFNKGILSDNYLDIETRETIRTFSFPLSDHYFLFVDISYSFIFENESLLNL